MSFVFRLPLNQDCHELWCKNRKKGVKEQLNKEPDAVPRKLESSYRNWILDDNVRVRVGVSYEKKEVTRKREEASVSNSQNVKANMTNFISLISEEKEWNDSQEKHTLLPDNSKGAQAASTSFVSQKTLHGSEQTDIKNTVGAKQLPGTCRNVEVPGNVSRKCVVKLVQKDSKGQMGRTEGSGAQRDVPVTENIRDSLTNVISTLQDGQNMPLTQIVGSQNINENTQTSMLLQLTNQLVQTFSEIPKNSVFSHPEAASAMQSVLFGNRSQSGPSGFSDVLQQGDNFADLQQTRSQNSSTNMNTDVSWQQNSNQTAAPAAGDDRHAGVKAALAQLLMQQGIGVQMSGAQFERPVTGSSSHPQLLSNTAQPSYSDNLQVSPCTRPLDDPPRNSLPTPHASFPGGQPPRNSLPIAPGSLSGRRSFSQHFRDHPSAGRYSDETFDRWEPIPPARVGVRSRFDPSANQDARRRSFNYRRDW